MNNLFLVLINTIKARFQSILTKLRYLTNGTYIRTTVISKIRRWLTNIFSVRPRNKKDYYSIFRWLVSKRLVHAIVIVIGVLSVCYLFWFDPIFDSSKLGGGEKIYSYSSIPLRFAEGKVKIKAKSGYIAYNGDVSKGYATGQGELYASDGSVIYNGQFEKNKYNGNGILYYPVGQVKYKGEFKDNLFHGTGELYRESGTKQYAGNFEEGFEEGEGVLYDGSEKQIFMGTFHRGEVVYTQFLDKTASEIKELYTGRQTIYQKNTEYMVSLDDIDAFYAAETDSESLEDTLKSNRVYVAKDSIVYGSEEISDIESLKKVFGEPAFEGNSYVTFPEAVVISWLQEQGMVKKIDVALDAEQPYTELMNVNGYAQDALIYLYVFQMDDLNYIFMSEDRDSDFFMYAIEK